MIFHSNIEELNDNTLVTVNDFISRSFLSRADKNYIAARQLFLTGLEEDFLTAAQQSLEKYLKSILLFNGERANKTHGLLKLFCAVQKLLIWDRNHDLNFPVYLLPSFCCIKEFLVQFLSRIEDNGMNRYGSFIGFNFRGDELYKLDWAVNLFRRYCKCPNAQLCLEAEGKTSEEKKEIWWRSIRTNEAIINGFLEEVMERENFKQLKYVLLRGNCFLRRKLPAQGSEELITLQNEVNWRMKGVNSAIQNIYERAESTIGDKRNPDNMLRFLKVISYLRKKVYFTPKEDEVLQGISKKYLDELLLAQKE